MPKNNKEKKGIRLEVMNMSEALKTYVIDQAKAKKISASDYVRRLIVKDKLSHVEG